MSRWQFSRARYVPRALRGSLRRDCAALVLSNVQPQVVVPFLVGARRLGIPIVAHVASWDHTVGKGVIAPFCDVYVVQNATMRDDLVRYHDIPPERIVVTGWPQTDVYARPRAREEFDRLVVSYGLDPALPLVVVMGNTPTNAPFEDRFVERLVGWWEEAGRGRMSLLFRPHPRDRAWRERFAVALSTPGVHVQEASFTDLEILATVLEHAACVVANAGTILLEAVVNDRPCVCVLYDEGAPEGESWALKNVDRRALPGARPLECLLPGGALRGGRRRHRALARVSGRAGRGARPRRGGRRRRGGRPGRGARRGRNRRGRDGASCVTSSRGSASSSASRSPRTSARRGSTTRSRSSTSGPI